MRLDGRLNLRVPAQLVRKIEAVAAAEGTDPAKIARRAIARGLPRTEAGSPRPAGG